jgi:hypothetical protein
MSAQTPARVWTYKLSAAMLTILKADNVTAITLFVVSGTVNLLGNFQFQNSAAGGALASTSAPLSAGASYTFASGGPEAPIDNFTIDATAGVCSLVFNM